ncbi:MAG: hypothetical protein V1917_02150 [Candidatus Gottesmanbacteria bacterium]
MNRQEVITPKDLVVFRTEKVPFVEQLISSLPGGITKNACQDIERTSHLHDESYIATQITRQVDRSGLIPNLADVAGTPEDVFDILHPIGAHAIETINALPDALKSNVFSALNQQTCTPDVLVWLNAMFGNIVEPLKKYRGEKSEKLRAIAIQTIYSQHGYDKNKPLITLHSVFDNDAKLDYVNQTYEIPRITEEAKQHILTITPDFLQRDRDEDHPVNTPRGFLQKIGLIGVPFTRELAKYAKKIIDLNLFDEQTKRQLERFDEHIRSLP